MFNKIKTRKFFSRFKYVIVIVVGVALITVIGENSLLQRFKYNRQISDLREEIERQETQFMQDSIKLLNLERNPEEVRKIARERYFMKKDDEDIFVLSDELEGVEDEATE